MMKGFANLAPRRGNATVPRLLVVSFLLWVFCAAVGHAAGEQKGGGSSDAMGVDATEVIVDGRVVLTVRGISAYPAKRRAREIEKAIISGCRDAQDAKRDIQVSLSPSLVTTAY